MSDGGHVTDGCHVTAAAAIVGSISSSGERPCRSGVWGTGTTHRGGECGADLWPELRLLSADLLALCAAAVRLVLAVSLACCRDDFAVFSPTV